MRTIKFRGRRIDNGEWVYGNLHIYKSDNHLGGGKSCLRVWILSEFYPDTTGWDIEDTYFAHEVDPATVGQFTGLVDRNGVEVFEGDRVLYGGLENIIQWNHLHCCWGLFQYGNYVAELGTDWIDENGNAPKQWINSEIEVIGNIYSNPDIL